MNRKILTWVALVLLMFSCQMPAADEKRDGAKALLDSDRVLIREAQLVLAQAHIARLQAEVQVKENTVAIQASERKLTDLLESLKKQYACSDCELGVDFTWTKKPAPSKPETSPAPGGQSETKE